MEDKVNNGQASSETIDHQPKWFSIGMESKRLFETNELQKKNYLTLKMGNLL